MLDATSSTDDFTLIKISDEQDGYSRDGNVHTFTIKLVLKTVPVTLWKRDAQDTKDLAGAVFTLNSVKMDATGADGKVSLEGAVNKQGAK